MYSYRMSRVSMGGINREREVCMSKGYKLINQTIAICIDGMDND